MSPDLATNTQVILKRFIPADASENDFEVRKSQKISTSDQSALKDDQILVKQLYFSLDPYLRGRMKDTGKASYIPSFQPGELMESAAIAQVLLSKSSRFKLNDFVSYSAKTEEYSILDVNDKTQINKIQEIEGLPLTYYLSVLGMPGMTAFSSLIKIAAPKQGETIFVSSASGAVGMAVCGLCKIWGLRVVGTAGSDEKVDYLKNVIGIDDAFNYKTCGSLADKIASLFPNRLNIYFDNVGGELLDAVLPHMADHGRVVACGAISGYDKAKGPPIYNYFYVVARKLKWEGFIVWEFFNDKETHYEKVFIPKMVEYLKSGQLKYKEDVWNSGQNGLEEFGRAFLGLMKGQNNGKLILKV